MLLGVWARNPGRGCNEHVFVSKLHSMHTTWCLLLMMQLNCQDAHTYVVIWAAHTRAVTPK